MRESVVKTHYIKCSSTVVEIIAGQLLSLLQNVVYKRVEREKNETHANC